MIVLAGDIGGTKTNLGLFDVQGQQVTSIYQCTWKSADYNQLEAIIEQFLVQLKEQPATQSLNFTTACFGIAGPVNNNRCEVTNLPWVVDGQLIRKKFSWQYVSLLNDLEANAWGIGALDSDDFVTLNAGVEQQGNASIIAAGTGLGEAGLFWDGAQHIPFASEGGHTDFSPATDQDYRLYQYLTEKYQGHVSWERVVSGMGIVNLYEFLCHDGNIKPPEWLIQQMVHEDAAAAISQAAAAKKDALCVQAMDWFAYLYGAETGNHALKIMAKGGVFIGGGIAPKIISQLQNGRFLDGFFAKGRMQPLMKAMPVKVIMNDKTALYGPAVYAAQLS
jgi:glucokinase